MREQVRVEASVTAMISTTRLCCQQSQEVICSPEIINNKRFINFTSVWSSLQQEARTRRRSWRRSCELWPLVPDWCEPLPWARVTCWCRVCHRSTSTLRRCQVLRTPSVWSKVIVTWRWRIACYIWIRVWRWYYLQCFQRARVSVCDETRHPLDSVVAVRFGCRLHRVAPSFARSRKTHQVKPVRTRQKDNSTPRHTQLHTCFTQLRLLSRGTCSKSKNLISGNSFAYRTSFLWNWSQISDVSSLRSSSIDDSIEPEVSIKTITCFSTTTPKTRLLPARRKI